MILPDVNLLLYAHDESGPFHERARDWWQSCLEGREPVGLCTVVVSGFVRIGTSRAAFADPLTIDEAASLVEEWLDRAVTEVVDAREADIGRAFSLLREAGAGGNLTTDALIAAIAARYRATVHTADTDFLRFPGVRWVNPLIPGSVSERQ